MNEDSKCHSQSTGRERLFELLVERSGISVAPPKKMLRTSRPGPKPLTSGQEEVWRLDQLNPDLPVCNTAAAFRLTGTVDLCALTGALEAAIRRHEILRTSFPVIDGCPAQVVMDDCAFRLAVIDLRRLPPVERRPRSLEAARILAEQPFDLTRAPLIRAGLILAGLEESLLILVLHLAIADDWAIKLLVDEVAASYESFSNGRPSPLVEPALQFSDFALWDRSTLREPVRRAPTGLERKQRDGGPPRLELPADYSPAAQRQYASSSLTLALSAGLTEKVRALSRSENTTLFVTILTALKVFLSRYSANKQVIVGTPITSRTSPEQDRVIGRFTNNVALRTDLSDDPSFRLALNRICQTVLQALEHPTPVEADAEESPGKTSSDEPRFQVMLSMRPVPVEYTINQSKWSSFQISSKTSIPDLLFEIEDGGGKLDIRLQYSTELFMERSAQRLLGHLESVLKTVVSDPACRISKLVS